MLNPKFKDSLNNIFVLYNIVQIFSPSKPDVKPKKFTSVEDAIFFIKKLKITKPELLAMLRSIHITHPNCTNKTREQLIRQVANFVVKGQLGFFPETGSTPTSNKKSVAAPSPIASNIAPAAAAMAYTGLGTGASTITSFQEVVEKQVNTKIDLDKKHILTNDAGDMLEISFGTIAGSLALSHAKDYAKTKILKRLAGKYYALIPSSDMLKKFKADPSMIVGILGGYAFKVAKEKATDKLIELVKKRVIKVRRKDKVVTPQNKPTQVAQNTQNNSGSTGSNNTATNAAVVASGTAASAKAVSQIKTPASTNAKSQTKTDSNSKSGNTKNKSDSKSNSSSTNNNKTSTGNNKSVSNNSKAGTENKKSATNKSNSGTSGNNSAGNSKTAGGAGSSGNSSKAGAASGAGSAGNSSNPGAVGGGDSAANSDAGTASGADSAGNRSNPGAAGGTDSASNSGKTEVGGTDYSIDNSNAEIGNDHSTKKSNVTEVSSNPSTAVAGGGAAVVMASADTAGISSANALNTTNNITEMPTSMPDGNASMSLGTDTISPDGDGYGNSINASNNTTSEISETPDSQINSSTNATSTNQPNSIGRDFHESQNTNLGSVSKISDTANASLGSGIGNAVSAVSVVAVSAKSSGLKTNGSSSANTNAPDPSIKNPSQRDTTSTTTKAKNTTTVDLATPMPSAAVLTPETILNKTKAKSYVANQRTNNKVIHSRYDDPRFEKIIFNTGNNNVCTPAVVNSNWTGIKINAPKVIYTNGGKLPIFPVCAVLCLNLLSSAVDDEVMLEIINTTSHKIDNGKFKIVDTSPSSVAEPKLRNSNIISGDNNRVKIVSNLTVNLVEQITFPNIDATYNIRMLFKGSISNTVVVQVKSIG